MILDIFNSLSRWCIPVFVAISGCIFLNPKKKIKYKDIFFKYILRVALVLLIWGFVCGFYLNRDLSWDNIIFIMKNIASGQANYHFWYLYMLIGLYLLTPILKVFINNAKKRDLDYFMAICFTLTVLLPQLSHLPHMGWVKLGTDALLAPNLFYVFCYVLGYYVDTYRPDKLLKVNNKVIICVGILALVSGTALVSMLSMHHKSVAFGWIVGQYSLISSTVVVVASFVFAKAAYRRISEKTKYKIDFWGDLTFGIYIVHALLIVIMENKLGFYGNMMNPIVAVPLVTAVVFVLSAVGTYFLMYNGVFDFINIKLKLKLRKK